MTHRAQSRPKFPLCIEKTSLERFSILTCPYAG